MPWRWVLMLALGLHPLVATSATGGACETATTTREMSSCLQGELEQLEHRLKALDERISSQLEAQRRLLFRQAQLTWASFRFANCSSAKSQFEGGTMAPLVFVQCEIEMTRQRLAELREVYDSD